MVYSHGHCRYIHVQYTRLYNSIQPNLQRIYKVNQVAIIVNLVASFFSVLSVLRGHSFFHPRHNGQWHSTSKDFLSQILSITLFSYLNLCEKASIFHFQCWVLNKGTTGTIFITSLVWPGPWLGIEPGTSGKQWNCT